jgi:hypothetical protein
MKKFNEKIQYNYFKLTNDIHIHLSIKIIKIKYEISVFLSYLVFKYHY